MCSVRAATAPRFALARGHPPPRQTIITREPAGTVSTISRILVPRSPTAPITRTTGNGLQELRHRSLHADRALCHVRRPVAVDDLQLHRVVARRRERHRRGWSVRVVEQAVVVEVPRLAHERAVGVRGEGRQHDAVARQGRAGCIGESRHRRPVVDGDRLCLTAAAPGAVADAERDGVDAGRGIGRLSRRARCVVARPVAVEIPCLRRDVPGRGRGERDRARR